ncbi:MAG: TIGR00725 family protein [Brevinematales bacterium]|nr:TIGR00725 family protein [Brevinematales bacterium]
MNRKKQVLLIGDSGEFEDKNRVAYEIGKFVARNGWILITGGRDGVMDWASKGAFEEGGIVVAITPYDSLDNATKFATIVIPTGMGFARNYINVLSADVVVVVGGGAGTLSEIAYAWQFNKPIISCSFVEGWSKEVAGKKIDYRQREPIIEAGSVDEVFRKLSKILGY